MRIRLDGGLLFVTATLTLGGRTRELQNVLLDTGSSGSLFDLASLELRRTSPSGG